MAGERALVGIFIFVLPYRLIGDVDEENERDKVCKDQEGLFVKVSGEGKEHLQEFGKFLAECEKGVTGGETDHKAQ